MPDSLTKTLTRLNGQRLPSSIERDRHVLELHDQLMEIEQRLIPTGLHVLGQPSAPREKADVLRMVASFDRPEVGAQALPDLVAEGLGLAARISPVGSRPQSEEELRDRERIDAIVGLAIQEFLNTGLSNAVQFLETKANVKAEDSRPI